MLIPALFLSSVLCERMLGFFFLIKVGFQCVISLLLFFFFSFLCCESVLLIFWLSETRALALSSAQEHQEGAVSPIFPGRGWCQSHLRLV